MPFFTNRGITPLPVGGGGLLLDLITPQPTLAIGTRRLRTAYAGSALTISGTTGLNSEDIGFSGDEIDVAAITVHSDGIGGTNSWVKQYWDQSANANHLTLSGGGASHVVRASSTNSTVNSHIAPDTNTLPFAYTKSGLVLSSVVSASAFTILVSVSVNSFPAKDPYQGAIINDLSAYLSAAKFVSRSASNIFGTNVYDGADNEANKACTTGAHVGVTKLGSGTLSSWVDGGTPATDTTGNIQTVTAAFQFTDAHVDVRILEVLVYNVALSSADINTLGADMAARAGVTWTSI